MLNDKEKKREESEEMFFSKFKEYFLKVKSKINDKDLKHSDIN